LLSLLVTGCVDDLELGEASSAVSTLVLEAEDATNGAGVVESDGSASGGAVLVLSPGTFAHQPFTTTGSLVNGTVRVRGESCLPWIRVRIDFTDVVPSMQLSTDQWTVIGFTGGAGLPAGNHTLELHHRNGSCAVRYDQVTLTLNDPPPPPPPPPPVVVEAESASGAGTVVADAAASGGAYREFSAAYQKASRTFTTAVGTTGTVRVRATGCAYAPYAKVTIDGVVATMTQIWQNDTWVTLSLGQWSGGGHAIELEYRYGRAGCVLQFDHATFTP
ncbi:MAG TPA: hypothetical protein VFO79_03775, partial [Xanthomonadales bacterium]|nr:hypothetical protein [Xanthomonadales bacterium]